MAVIGLCALGAGITGTMLWAENRPSVPAKVVPATAPASLPLPDIPLPNLAPSNAAGNQVTQSGAQEPPSGLTNGMSPPEAALTLGNWFYDHERWQLAVDNYQTAIKGGVDNPNIRTDLGNALRFSDRPKEALEQYQRAQKQDPTHEQSLFNQGALYAVSLKNPRKGMEMWQAYLKRFPDGASAKQARELMAKFAGKQ